MILYMQLLIPGFMAIDYIKMHIKLFGRASVLLIVLFCPLGLFLSLPVLKHTILSAASE